MKKIVLYFFAGIGVLAVAWLIFQVVFGGIISFSSRSPYGYTGGYTGDGDFAPSPLGSSKIGLTLPSLPDVSSQRESNVSQPQLVSEGELTQRKVIKNGSLSILVKKAEEVADGIQAITGRLGGFVGESQIYEVSAGVKSGWITIRIPADRFDEAMAEIKKLAIRVERENVNAQDVTEQFVDLEAQLKNSRAEEAQYLEIMKRAVTVEDTLKVSQQLSIVRGRIEQIQGQLQYLSRQVDMATITVSLTAEADTEIFGIRWRPLLVIKQALRNMLTGFTGYIDAMIGFVFFLPVLLFWVATIAIVAIGGWKVFRLVKGRFFS